MATPRTPVEGGPPPTAPAHPAVKPGPQGPATPAHRQWNGPTPPTIITIFDWWGIVGGAGYTGAVTANFFQFPLSKAIGVTDLLPVCYGSVRIGGAAIWLQPAPDDNLRHGQGVIAWCEGPINAVAAMYSQGQNIGVSFPDNGYYRFTRTDYVGANGQSQQAGAGEVFFGKDVSHFTNVAYTYLDMLITSGLPMANMGWWSILRVQSGSAAVEFAADVQGLLIYDPRQDSTNGGSGSQRYTDPTTWTYSNNPALIVRDLMVRYGSISNAMIDDVSFAAAAAACDTAGFTCNVGFAATTLLADAIACANQTCNGQLIMANGRWGYFVDVVNTAPAVVSVDEEAGDIYGLQYEWLSTRQRYTRMAVSFLDSNANYVQNQTPNFDDPGVASNQPQDNILTATTGTNVIVLATAPGWAVNDTVLYRSFGSATIPGLSDGAIYYIKTITGASVTLSLTSGGAVVPITSTVAGVYQYLQRVGTSYPPLVPVRAQLINAPGINTMAAAIILRDYLFNSQANTFRVSGSMTMVGEKLAQGSKVHISTLKDVVGDYLITQITGDVQGFFTFVASPYDPAVYSSTPYTEPNPVTNAPQNYSPFIVPDVPPPCMSDGTNDVTPHSGTLLPVWTTKIYFDLPRLLDTPTLYGATHWSHGTGVTNWDASKINDGNKTVRAATADSVGNNGLISLDLGSGVAEEFIAVDLTNLIATGGGGGGGGFPGSQVDVAWSDDGSTYYAIIFPANASNITGAGPPTTSRIEWQSVGAHRYWNVAFNTLDVIFPPGTDLADFAEIQFYTANHDYYPLDHIEIRQNAAGNVPGAILGTVSAAKQTSKTTPLDLTAYVQYSQASGVPVATLDIWLLVVNAGGVRSTGRRLTVVSNLTTTPGTPIQSFLGMQTGADATTVQAGVSTAIDGSSLSGTDDFIEAASPPALSASGHTRLYADTSGVMWKSHSGGAFAHLVSGGGAPTHAYTPSTGITGTINDSNTTFTTTANSSVASIFLVIMDGIIDFAATWSGTTLTPSSAPHSSVHLLYWS